jgi:hypothetical protein
MRLEIIKEIRHLCSTGAEGYVERKLPCGRLTASSKTRGAH